MKRSDEQLLMLAAAVYLYARGSGWWASQTQVSLPSGAAIPGQGELVQVDTVKTVLDPNGFPALMNAALQVVERGLVAQVLDPMPAAFPQPAAPDPDYDLPARVFAMQAAVECGDGKSCYHYNVGNVTTASGRYFLNPPDDTAHRYAVYLYPLQGAVGMVELVKRRWPDAYRAAYSGAVSAFVRALKPEGKPQYFEAAEKPYRNAMLARGKRFGWDAGVAGAATSWRVLAPPKRVL